eukprot:TRINITY_DN2990_c0_g1_i1.p1 TRINITY_DN2990_c0_g1~~TRINITY_DN2990_c0_g1_i1.p1  ORF type:complete len:790 (-),score=77.15 TRINITY_DN2990_c0_g1_i1:311-2647(-)
MTQHFCCLFQFQLHSNTQNKRRTNFKYQTHLRHNFAQSNYLVFCNKNTNNSNINNNSSGESLQKTPLLKSQGYSEAIGISQQQSEASIRIKEQSEVEFSQKQQQSLKQQVQQKKQYQTQQEEYQQMEVTKHNFWEVFPEVEKAVKECTYYAFDLEMSGVQLESSDKYDLVEDRYAQITECARQFLVLQFGLATFVYDPQNNQCEAKCFNFYLFPQYQKLMNELGTNIVQIGNSNGNFANIFASQFGSLEFLAEQGFDFNKCFRDGISFMQIKQYEALKKQTATMADTKRLVSILSVEDQKLAADLKVKLRAWFYQSKEKVMIVERYQNSHQRSIQQMIIEKFRDTIKDKDKTFVLEKVRIDTSNSQTRSNFNTQFRCVRMSRKEANKHSDQVLSDKMQAIEDAAMFCNVVRLLMESQKPIVGHNALLDLAYTYQSFNKDLPTTWYSFKKMLQKECFPVIYDTKYLVEECEGLVGQFKRSNLQEVYKGLVEREWMDRIQAIYALAQIEYEDAPLPTITHSKDFTRYEINIENAVNSNNNNGDRPRSFDHEAGYDAFVTGASFACLMRILELQALVNGSAKSIGYEMNMKGVLPHMGRTLLPRSDYMYVNMMGDDPDPDRSNILYVHSIQETMRSNEVLARFRQVDQKCRFFMLKEGKRLQETEGQEGMAILASGLAAQYVLEKMRENIQITFKVEQFDYYQRRRQLSTLKTQAAKQAFLKNIQKQQQESQSSAQKQDDESTDLSEFFDVEEEQEQRPSLPLGLLKKPEWPNKGPGCRTQ